MRIEWLELVAGVLRPARPDLERCARAGELHLEQRRLVAERRARALADCVARIESTRAAVFAANDGVVTARMTDLEREWRTLSRSDPDAGLMDLWARIAPASWIDRKRWRDSATAARLDAAIALAADVEGVERAEAAIDALRVACADWGTSIGPRARWRAFDHDADRTAELLDAPLCAAGEALSTLSIERVVLERAHRIEQGVHDAVRARLPERPLLARGIAHAAFVDCVWHAAPLAGRANPVAALCDLWRTGYVLTAVGASGVTLEIPPLESR